jgi:molecular chaperone GrpE
MAKKSKIQEDVLDTKTTEEITEETKELTKEELLENQIKELKEQVTKLQNDYLKEKADVENVKKRLEKERITERKYAAFSVAKKLIGPLDNFELALNHQVEDEAVQSFVQGFKMIQDQIKKGLEEEGVSEIDALNEEYDPNFHQAIMTEKKEGVEPNVVIEVLQKGYIFKDRVIRPAIVKISE